MKDFSGWTLLYKLPVYMEGRTDGKPYAVLFVYKDPKHNYLGPWMGY